MTMTIKLIRVTCVLLAPSRAFATSAQQVSFHPAHDSNSPPAKSIASGVERGLENGVGTPDCPETCPKPELCGAGGPRARALERATPREDAARCLGAKLASLPRASSRGVDSLRLAFGQGRRCGGGRSRARAVAVGRAAAASRARQLERAGPVPARPASALGRRRT